MENRIAALRQRHSEIDDAVRREAMAPEPNSMRLKALKKARLKVKDEIGALVRRYKHQEENPVTVHNFQNAASGGASASH